MNMLELILLSSTSLVFIGLYGVLTRKNLFRILLALNLIETGINLLLVAFGYVENGEVAILSSPMSLQLLGKMVDPVPQALVLTSIVIGLGTTAFALGLTVRYHQTHGSVQLDESDEEEVVNHA